jgi:putative ABC transport system substrate-binding protein
VEILKEAITGLSRVGLLINPNTKFSRPYVEESKTAAEKFGLDFQIFEARSQEELSPAFEAVKKSGVQALSISPEGVFYQARAQLAELALADALPTCVWSKQTFEPGALLSYGPDLLAIQGRVAVFVDRILKGAKPADLPVEQPTRLQLLVNLKTAKPLGIELPFALLSRADEIIE